MTREFRLKVNGEEITVTAERKGSTISVKHGGSSYSVELLSDENAVKQSPRRAVASNTFSVPAPTGQDEAQQQAIAAPAVGGGSVAAPITGMVKEIVVSVGTKVKEGDLVVIMEAMKMDIEVTAANEGTVKEIFVTEGQSIQDGAALLRIR